MLINAKQFEKISIRGCVAYGICCLENALEHYNIQGDGWNILLKKLWWYTELSAENDPSIDNCLQLERWAYVSANISPHILKLFASYCDFSKKAKWWFKDNILTEQEYQLLKTEYINCNETIENICRQIHDIGTNDLWAGIGRTSPDTLRSLQMLIDLMNEQSIPLPPKEPFEQYVFHKKGWDYDLHGFGEIFDGTQYSKFIKTTK